MSLRSKLQPSDITIIIDKKEKTPFSLTVATKNGAIEIPTITGTLPTGDYSAIGFEDLIAVERKSLDDLIGCVGTNRDRFERECQRLLAYPSRCIVVEASMTQLAMGQWRSQVTPSQAIGSVVGWIEKGIPVVFPGNRQEAALFTARFIYTAVRRRYDRLYRGFVSKRLLKENKEESA